MPAGNDRAAREATEDGGGGRPGPACTAPVNVAVVYYSSTGTVYRIATEIARAALRAGALVRLRRAAELAPDDVIAGKTAWAEHLAETQHVPLATAADVRWADAVIFGTPTRFGNMCSQLKQFIDTLGPAWFAGELAHKAYSAFTSGGNTHGGMETTLVSMYNMVCHFGGVVVPPGRPGPSTEGGANPYGTSYVLGASAAPVDEATRGSAWIQAARVVHVARALKEADSKPHPERRQHVTSSQEFTQQRPLWSTDTSEPDLEHATVEVPCDYSDPGGERITLALTRRLASDPARRRGILLAVNGGPGGDYGLGKALVDKFAGTRAHEVYDLVGFDPRGTGDSTCLFAEVTQPEAVFDSRPPDSAFSTIAEDMRRRELACSRAGGELRKHISTRNIARDMNVIRQVLGEDRLSFVGYAFGAYLGAVYGSMFGEHLDRNVLDSCVHPDWTWREQFLWQGDAVHRNVDAWAQWAGTRDARFALGTSAGKVLEVVEDVAAALDEQGDGPHLRTLFDGAVGNRATNRVQWQQLAELVGGLRDATEAGDIGRARALLADQNTWRASDSAGDLRIGVLEAITLEHEWPVDVGTYFQDMRDFRKRFPYGYGVLRAQPWVGAFRSFTAPEPPTALERDGYPTGIVVQADGDPMDHYLGGVAMAERLGHHLITIEDSGDHEIYRLAGNTELDSTVDRYLVDGVLPPRRTAHGGNARRPDVPADNAR